MKKILVLIIFFLSPTLYSCEKDYIPYKTENVYGNTPTLQRISTRRIIIPLQYGKWELQTASYNNGNNMLHLMHLRDPTKYKGKVFYEFVGDLSLYSESEISIIYLPKLIQGKNKKFNKSLCMKKIKLKWDSSKNDWIGE